MTLIDALPLTLLMAGVTYLIRMLPITLMRRKIKSAFLKSLLFYLPSAVLASMTIPAIFSSAGAFLPSLIGTIAGIVLSLSDKSLTVVALAASLSALITSLIQTFCF